jgi:hypothetical protein
MTNTKRESKWFFYNDNDTGDDYKLYSKIDNGKIEFKISSFQNSKQKKDEKEKFETSFQLLSAL